MDCNQVILPFNLITVRLSHHVGQETGKSYGCKVETLLYFVTSILSAPTDDASFTRRRFFEFKYHFYASTPFLQYYWCWPINLQTLISLGCTNAFAVGSVPPTYCLVRNQGVSWGIVAWLAERCWELLNLFLLLGPLLAHHLSDLQFWNSSKLFNSLLIDNNDYY